MLSKRIIQWLGGSGNRLAHRKSGEAAIRPRISENDLSSMHLRWVELANSGNYSKAIVDCLNALPNRGLFFSIVFSRLRLFPNFQL
jgi:hypothetical protein